MATWHETDYMYDDVTPPVVYDGVDPEDYSDDDAADWWVCSSRFGTVLLVGLAVLVAVIVIAQVVIAVQT